MCSNFLQVQEKILANWQRSLVLFTQKMVTKLSKNMGWGSGIRKKPIPDSGSRGRVKKAPDPEAGSAALLERIHKWQKRKWWWAFHKRIQNKDAISRRQAETNFILVTTPRILILPKLGVEWEELPVVGGEVYQLPGLQRYQHQVPSEE